MHDSDAFLSQMPFGCLRAKDSPKSTSFVSASLMSQMPFGCLRAKDSTTGSGVYLSLEVTNAFRLFASKGLLVVSRKEARQGMGSQMPFGCLRAKDSMRKA